MNPTDCTDVTPTDGPPKATAVPLMATDWL
jgi:hypothetical protein